MKLLLVEDDLRLTGLLLRGLRREGHAVDHAPNVEDGRWMATESTYDVMILDAMLPDGDGYTLCRELRTAGRWSPVLFLTARDAVEDRVRGLDAGGDDYLVKPFAFTELLARLRALSRRGAVERPSVLTIGDLEIDPAPIVLARVGRISRSRRGSSRCSSSSRATPTQSSAAA